MIFSLRNCYLQWGNIFWHLSLLHHNSILSTLQPIELGSSYKVELVFALLEEFFWKFYLPSLGRITTTVPIFPSCRKRILKGINIETEEKHFIYNFTYSPLSLSDFSKWNIIRSIEACSKVIRIKYMVWFKMWLKVIMSLIYPFDSTSTWLVPI